MWASEIGENRSNNFLPIKYFAVTISCVIIYTKYSPHSKQNDLLYIFLKSYRKTYKVDKIIFVQNTWLTNTNYIFVWFSVLKYFNYFQKCTLNYLS